MRLIRRPDREARRADEAAAPSGMTPPRVELGVFRTLAGRLFLLSAAFVVLCWALDLVVTFPLFLEIFRKVVSLAALASGVYLLALGLVHNRHRLLWRVRRKLILSYVFLGLVPVALVATFALAGGIVLYTNVASYLFHEGIHDLEDRVAETAAASAAEMAQTPGSAGGVLARAYQTRSTLYPELSLAVVPAPDGRPVTAGPWAHADIPVARPGWMGADGFTGILATQSAQGDGERLGLVIRAAVPVPGSGVVVADLPIDATIITQLDARTGARVSGVALAPASAPAPAFAPMAARPGAVAPQDGAANDEGGLLASFRHTVAFLDVTDWTTGATGRATVRLDAPVGDLYHRIASLQSSQVTSALGGPDFLGILVLLGVLFLVIQGSALVMGAVLARSITHAVHELFVGTERVREGDFAHRIRIGSHDQLGDLADSFNRMSASMVHLLHVQREKQRLDDELRIAREIQQSLLPSTVPELPGISVADLCEPAREVGGDYYDFFILGPRQLGVLVADVAGKGTSAALYMAELKGLMLSLSRLHRSPRRLLVEVNQLLANHLDNRSFITMMYAVVDLEARTLTCARAGHTPLLVVSGGRDEFVMPDGMVLGLRLPGARERFEQLLQEHTRPIRPGDVFVLYTDGVTEAMRADGELFGDAALARVVAAHHDLDAAGVRERVLREVRAFVGDAEPHDDMTMIVLKIDGGAPA